MLPCRPQFCPEHLAVYSSPPPSHWHLNCSIRLLPLFLTCLPFGSSLLKLCFQPLLCSKSFPPHFGLNTCPLPHTTFPSHSASLRPVLNPFCTCFSLQFHPIPSDVFLSALLLLELSTCPPHLFGSILTLLMLSPLGVFSLGRV